MNEVSVRSLEICGRQCGRHLAWLFNFWQYRPTEVELEEQINTDWALVWATAPVLINAVDSEPLYKGFHDWYLMAFAEQSMYKVSTVEGVQGDRTYPLP